MSEKNFFTPAGLFTDKKKEFRRDNLARDIAINFYISMLDCFTWKNLPDTIEQSDLERNLLSLGYVAVVPIDKKMSTNMGKPITTEQGLYALPCDLLGQDANLYYKPTLANVSHPILSTGKYNNMVIGKDCGLIRNDPFYYGINSIVMRWATLMADSLITMDFQTILARVPYYFSVQDGKTRDDIVALLKKIQDGDFSTFAVVSDGFANAFQNESKPLAEITGVGNQISQMIESYQFCESKFWNELGLNSNFNMKREALNESETNAGGKTLLPRIDRMLTTRKEDAEKINQLFGTNIEVELNEAWLLEKQAQVNLNSGDFAYDDMEPDTETSEEPEPDTETSEEPEPESEKKESEKKEEEKEDE